MACLSTNSQIISACKRPSGASPETRTLRARPGERFDRGLFKLGFMKYPGRIKMHFLTNRSARSARIDLPTKVALRTRWCWKKTPVCADGTSCEEPSHQRRGAWSASSRHRRTATEGRTRNVCITCRLAGVDCAGRNAIPFPRPVRPPRGGPSTRPTCSTPSKKLEPSTP